VLDNETKQKQHLEEKEILCYKVDRQIKSENIVNSNFEFCTHTQTRL